jgi:parvulin-like peptidyl-prolyl isomerase
MRRCAFLLVSVLLFIDGCGGGSKPRFTEEELARIPFAQKTGLPEASGGFVLAVGGESITSDDIIGSLIEHNGEVLPLKISLGPIAQTTNDFERFKEQAKPEVEQVLTNRLSSILLYQQAKRQAGEGIDEALERLAEAEARKVVISEFGGDDAKAEEALIKMGMDWQSFKERQKKLILSGFFVASQLPKARPITYSELLDRYNEMKDEFFVRPATVKFRLIDIEAAKLAVADPNQSQLERARELADELLRCLQTDEDFVKLAKEYSEVSFIDHSDGVQPENLEKPYDVLATEAEKIEPGQIAGPIEAGEHIFIMKLEEKRAKSFKPLREVQREVETKIMLDRQEQAREEIIAKLVQQTAIGQRSEFIDFCLKKIWDER